MIKRLKERIRYSLPNAGRIADSSAYRQLVNGVVKITENPSDIIQLNGDLMTLISQTAEFCKK